MPFLQKLIRKFKDMRAKISHRVEIEKAITKKHLEREEEERKAKLKLKREQAEAHQRQELINQPLRDKCTELFSRPDVLTNIREIFKYNRVNKPDIKEWNFTLAIEKTLIEHGVLHATLDEDHFYSGDEKLRLVALEAVKKALQSNLRNTSIHVGSVEQSYSYTYEGIGGQGDRPSTYRDKKTRPGILLYMK